MGSFSIWHWLVVLLIVILIFGSKKLKSLGQDLGESVKNFKKALNDDQSADDQSPQNEAKDKNK